MGSRWSGGPGAANVVPLTDDDRDELAQLWRRPHRTGWETIPCSCGVCRADRFVNRVAGILVGVCVGYFVGQILPLAIR